MKSKVVHGLSSDNSEFQCVCKINAKKKVHVARQLISYNCSDHLFLLCSNDIVRSLQGAVLSISIALSSSGFSIIPSSK